MSLTEPVVWGVAGLGGYAWTIVDLLLRCQAEPGLGVKLLACCSCDLVEDAPRVAQLDKENVVVLDSFEKLVAIPEIEAVWLPLPIDLHRSFTEMALRAGKAVMCEKPIAGCVDDVDAMIVQRDKAQLPVAIGYHDIYDPSTLQLKERLLNGAIGSVRSATVWACWPRGTRYYGRASWAGAMHRNGVWVMDSPANNAMAHYINIVLFLLGSTRDRSATPAEVEAELYRANPIENYDTTCMRVTLDNGAPFLIFLTHACEKEVPPRVVIHGESGELRWTSWGEHTLKTSRGIEVLRRERELRHPMVGQFCRLVRGVPDDRIAVSTLESARSHVLVVNGASEAAPVRNVPESAVRMIVDSELGRVRAIEGIEAVIEKCVEREKMLNESGLVEWSVPAGRRDLREYRHFAGPARVGEGEW